jgi:hypothetical protein
MNNSLDSNAGGYESSHNYGNPSNEISILPGDVPNNQSIIEKFLKDHQDATIEKNVWVRRILFGL